MAKRRNLTPDEILHDIRTRPAVPLIPHYSWAFDIGKSKAYAEAKAGGDAFIKDDGGKRIRVITAVLRKKLGIEV
jgi:hypothetical protein